MRKTMKATPLYLAFGMVVATFATALPAQAGLLSPVLWLARPRIEKRLTKKCLKITAGDDVELRERMTPACRDFAKPIAKCLIKQTDSTGRTFGVIVELIRGEFGDDSELVVKRCSASIIGLPINTFKNMPLLEIIERWK